MQHLMTDLETGGTAVNAPIFSIGACYFDPDTGKIGETFYEAIGWESAFMNGRASGSTMKWWMQQSDEARKAVISGTLRTEDVLVNFRRFCAIHGPNVTPWGNGATFDISMLEYHYQRVEDRPAPWKFWNVRDCRTIKDLAGKDFVMPERAGTHHHALDDALYQAKWVSQMWQALRGNLSTVAPTKVEEEYDPFA